MVHFSTTWVDLFIYKLLGSADNVRVVVKYKIYLSLDKLKQNIIT